MMNASEGPFLIVGLGNPGRQYLDTVHNLGFHLVDQVAVSLQTFFPNDIDKKFSAWICHSAMTIQDGASKKTARVILVKPSTYMNNSGISVLKLLSFYKIPSESVFVIHDDTDLEFCRIKIKKGGSDAGHNGIRSIDKTIGQSYWRVRFGVKSSTTGNFRELSSYVLSKIEDPEKLKLATKSFTKHFDLILEKDKNLLVQNYTKEFMAQLKSLDNTKENP